MKAVILGRLRICLEQLVWYSPSGTPGSQEESEQPGISIKTVDSESAITIRYKNFDARDADLILLDHIFDAERAAKVIQEPAKKNGKPLQIIDQIKNEDEE